MIEEVRIVEDGDFRLFMYYLDEVVTMINNRCKGS
jgi:hypothetical protein